MITQTSRAMACTLCALAAFALPSQAEPPIRPGDRIAIIGNTFADQLRIHGYLETLLLQHSKGEPVSVRNLGWGGDRLTSRDRPTGFPTEASTLAAHKTDVIIACFGMGESFAGVEGVGDFKANLRDFAASHRGKKYNGESEVRLILVSPIAYEDLGTLTPAQEKRNLELGAYTEAMGQVADSAGLPFVNLFEESGYLMREWEDGDFTTNGIHLTPTGYWAVGKAMFAQLAGAPAPSWRIRIDVDNGKIDASGVAVGQFSKADVGFSFEVNEKTAPSLPPPTEIPLPDQLASRRDTLAVSNLDPGNYTLSVDGEPVVTASHTDWAAGVPIDKSPAHREAEALRAAVNEKNLQFTYSWKALNQVHIVGERRKSPSGRALPAEVIEFNKLAIEKEKTLPALIGSKTRNWKLLPEK